MNRTSNECSTASDCTFDNAMGVTVHRFCYEEMNDVAEVFFCDCSNTYGFTGENCDQSSPQTVLLYIIMIFQLIVTVVAIPNTFYILWIYVKARKAMRVEESSTNDSFYIAKCLFLITTSLILIIARIVSEIMVLNDPTTTTIINSRRVFAGDLQLIYGPLGRLTFYCIVLSIYFLILTTALVLLSWLRVILGVKMIVEERTIRRIERFINGTLAVLAISSILLFGFMIAEYRLAASTIYTVISLFLLALNIYARRTFILTVEELTIDEKGVDIIRTVKRYSAVYVGGFLFNTLVLIIYAGVGLPLSRITPPGEIEYATLIVEVSTLVQYFLVYFALSYMCYLVNNLMTSTGCGAENKPSPAKSLINSA